MNPTTKYERPVGAFETWEEAAAHEPQIQKWEDEPDEPTQAEIDLDRAIAAHEDATAEATYEDMLREQQARRDRGEPEPEVDGEIPF